MTESENTTEQGAKQPVEHRSVARIFADFLGLTAAVQAANAEELEKLQEQIHALKVEIDSHPEVDTNTSLTAAAVLDNAVAQPADTAVATVPETVEAPAADDAAAPVADPAESVSQTATA